MIKELERIPLDGERWRAKVIIIRDMVNRHFEREEDEIFNLARGALEQNRLETLNEKYEKTKDEMPARK